MYVLKSLKDGKMYIGSTKDLKQRMKKHNSGLVKSTKMRKPFVLGYYEAYFAESDARHREQSLKLRGRALYQLLKRIEVSIVASEARLV